MRLTSIFFYIILIILSILILFENSLNFDKIYGISIRLLFWTSNNFIRIPIFGVILPILKNFLEI